MDECLEEGLSSEFPPLMFEVYLQIYAGGRVLSGEQLASAVLYPGSGLLQGYPCAPELISPVPPTQTPVERKLLTRHDLWLGMSACA